MESTKSTILDLLDKNGVTRQNGGLRFYKEVRQLNRLQRRVKTVLSRRKRRALRNAHQKFTSNK